MAVRLFALSPAKSSRCHTPTCVRQGRDKRERDCARARFLEKESEEHLDGEGVGAESGLSQPVIQRCQFIDHLLQIVRLHLHATTTRVMP